MSDGIGRLEQAKELLDQGLPEQALARLKASVPAFLESERSFLTAESLRARGFFAQAAAKYRKTISGLSAGNDPDLLIEACLGLVRVMRSLGRTGGALRFLDQARMEAKKIRASRHEEALLIEEALLDRAAQRYGKSIAQLRRLLAAFRRRKDWAAAGFMLWAIAGARRFDGDLAGSERDFFASLSAFKRAGDPEGMGYAFFGLGGVSRIRGKLRQSQKFYSTARKSFAKTQDLFAQAYAECGLANVLRQRGELGSAERHYRRSWALYARLGDKVDLAYVDWGLGKIALQQGRLGPARRRLRLALASFKRHRETRGIVLAETALAGALHAGGSTAAAESLFAQAVRRARKARIHAHLEIFT